MYGQLFRSDGSQGSVDPTTGHNERQCDAPPLQHPQLHPLNGCQACVRAAARGANAPPRDLEAAFREKLGETGDAGIHRITNGVDDGCVGQRKVDQAGKEKIRRHLVRVAGHVGTEMALHVMAYNKKRVMRILGVGGLIEAIRA
jgi:hypothetical protein